MDSATSIEVLQAAIVMAATIATPILLVGLVVGFLISLFQAVTQIQDQTVSAVPKIVAIVFALVLFLPWITDHLVEYTRTTYEQIPELMQK